LVDFDGDGKSDVISGSYSPGELYLFRRKADGTFAAGEKILDKNGKPINVGSASAPFAVDWDNDGDLDLIVGNIDGQVFLVPNEGTRQKAAYGTPEPLMADGKPIRVGGDAGPTVADWDGDGLPDLLVGGGDSTVRIYRSTKRGPDGRPLLSSDRVLGPGVGSQLGTRLKLCVADFNGDGRPDLLVGDFNYNQPVLSPQEQAVQQNWQALSNEYSRLMAEAASPLTQADTAETVRLRYEKAEQSEKAKALRQRIAEAQKQLPAGAGPPQMHGFVWLFVRRDAGLKSAAAH
jgi:hypothetical protein